MPEQISTTPELASQPAEAVFQQRLEEFGADIPEIAEHQQALVQHGEELIQGFGIQPEFFDDKGRSLVFAGVTKRFIDSQSIEFEGEKGKEQVFLSQVVTSLINNQDPNKKSESGLTDREQQVIYDKYTDPRLSSELQQAIDGGLLDGLKSRMGVTPENEDPYQLRVLTIDTGNNLLGLNAPAFEWDESRPLSENMKKAAESQATYEDVRDYGKGLEKRNEEFASELGIGANEAGAWVTMLNGKKQLCITMPLAEKILYPELTENAPFYDAEHRERDVAFLEHEYVHTQGGLNLDNETYVGINAEEVRAEYFSGNKHGYYDVKGFFNDMITVAGFDIREALDAYPKGGQSHEIYGLIANEVGLNRMVELLLVAPRNYCQKDSGPEHGAFNYLGGYDGVTERVLEDKIEAGNAAIIESRIDERAKTLKAIGANAEFVMGYRKGNGLNTVTDLVRDRFRYIEKQPPH